MFDWDEFGERLASILMGLLVSVIVLGFFGYIAWLAWTAGFGGWVIGVVVVVILAALVAAGSLIIPDLWEEHKYQQKIQAGRVSEERQRTRIRKADS